MKNNKERPELNRDKFLKGSEFLFSVEAQNP